MIIKIIATALIQCATRTHAGWITVAVAGTARSSLAARLDILFLGCSIIEIRYPIIRQALRVRYLNTGYSIDAWTASRSQKSEPDCPGSRPPVLWGQIRRGGSYEGISTVSTTWMTPFDWLTLGIVTVEEFPLESMIITLPSDFLMVSCSPSTVLSFLPSVKSEAASLPATT